jgi:hypothetical protein
MDDLVVILDCCLKNGERILTVDIKKRFYSNLFLLTGFFKFDIIVIIKLQERECFSMTNSKELIKKTLTEQFLNYQLPSDTKDRLIELTSEFIRSKLKLRKQLLWIERFCENSGLDSSFDEKIVISINDLKIPVTRTESFVPGIKKEKIISEGEEGVVRSVEIILDDKMILQDLDVLKEPKLEVVLKPKIQESDIKTTPKVQDMIDIGQPVVLNPIPEDILLMLEKEGVIEKVKKDSETVKVALNYSNTFVEKEDESISEVKKEDNNITEIQKVEIENSIIQSEVDPVINTDNNVDKQLNEKTETNEVIKTVENSELEQGTVVEVKSDTKSVKEDNASKKPFEKTILNESDYKVVVRNGLPAYQSKELFGIEGEIFLDFYKAYPKKSEAQPLLVTEPSAKTASIIPSSSEGKVYFLIEDCDEPQFVESKELKRIQELTKLVSPNPKEEPRIEKVPKGRKQSSSKEVNALVTSLLEKLINNGVKRLILEGPNDLAAGSDKKDTFNDFIIRRIIRDVKNKGLKLEVLLANPNKLNYSNKVDFEDSYYPNLFYFSRQDARFKSTIPNHLKNLIRLFDPSFKQK